MRLIKRNITITEATVKVANLALESIETITVIVIGNHKDAKEVLVAAKAEYESETIKMLSVIDYSSRTIECRMTEYTFLKYAEKPVEELQL